MAKKDSVQAVWDRRISFYVFFFFFATISNIVIKNVLPLSEDMWSLLSTLWGAAIMFFMVINIPEVYRRASIVLFRSICVFIILYFVSLCLNVFRNAPVHLIFSHGIFNTFLFWIPIGVSAYAVQDKSILYDVFYRGSFVLSALLWINFFWGVSNQQSVEASVYSMTFGFSMVIPLLFQISHLFKKANIFLFLLVILEIAAMLIFANRGCLLAIIFFVAYKLLFEKKNTAAAIIYLVVGLTFCILLAFSFKAIVGSLINILADMGIVSRSLNLLAYGEALQTSGRDEIWAICRDMINERPIMGWGLSGEYYEIASRLSDARQVTAEACNPHNGIIQFFVQFGLFGGLVVSLLFILPLFRLRMMPDCVTREIVLITGAAVIVPCMVSAADILGKPLSAIYLFLYIQGFSKKKE